LIIIYKKYRINKKMACVNDNNNKNDFLNSINNPLQKEYDMSKMKNKNKKDIKLFLYNKNFDLYNNLINNNYPNTYNIKFMEKCNEHTKIKKSSHKNKDESTPLFIKPNKCIIEDDNYYDAILKNHINSNNKNKPLERRKQSISGKIFEKEYYEKGSNKMRIIKSKYVEILPDKKDNIRAKLVKLNYASKKTLYNNQYDFYGDNCSFLSKNNDNDEDDNLFQEINEAKKRNNLIYKNNNNNILFVNTSLFKKKLEDFNEKDNPSLMQVDELDINKTENRNWKQNVLQTQLETLNETNDKTKIPINRKTGSLEALEKNNNELITNNNNKLTCNNDFIEDEKITIFKDFNNDYNEDKDLIIDDNENSIIEVKSREINLDNIPKNCNHPFIKKKGSVCKNPFPSKNILYNEQSKKLNDNYMLNGDNKKTSNTAVLTPSKYNNFIKDDETDANSIDEYLLDNDQFYNTQKCKIYSLKNYSENCLDKMLMKYPDDKHKNKIRFHLSNDKIDKNDDKASESISSSTPSTPESDSKKNLRGKSPKTTSTSQKPAAQKSLLQKLKKGNSNTPEPSNDNESKKKGLASILGGAEDSNAHHSHGTMHHFSLLHALHANNIKTSDIPTAEPKKNSILDIDLIQPIKNKEVIEFISKNNSIPFEEKVSSFRQFHYEMSKLMQKIKEDKEKKDKEEIIKKKKDKDMELINLLKKLHEEQQQEIMITQELEGSKKGGKKIKRIPSETLDKKGNANANANAINNAQAVTSAAEKAGLSIKSVFHISMMVKNIRTQVNNTKKATEDDKDADSNDESDTRNEELIRQYMLKLQETKKKLQLDESNLLVLKQYDANLKDKLRIRIKENILKYEVKNIEKYYKKKGNINIYNLSSQIPNKVENGLERERNISNAGSLMDIKTNNKINNSVYHSINKTSLSPHEFQIPYTNNNEQDTKKSNNNSNGEISNENKLLNSDLYKLFCKCHPSKFKNPIEQVKNESNVTLPTIADYKNKLFYHNNRVIDLNKKERNFNNSNNIDQETFNNVYRSRVLRSKSSINTTKYNY